MRTVKSLWLSWAVVLPLTLVVTACNKDTTPVTPGPTSTTFTVAGRVTDATTTAGIAGASVRITGGTGTNFGKNTTTDASGNYSITGVTAERIIMEATATGYQVGSASPTISANTTQNFALTPNPAPTPSTFTISGTVTDATSGGVLPNISVRITGGTSPNFGKNATTNAAGQYSITDVTPERIVLEASAPAGGYTVASASPTITANTTVNFTMTRLTATTGTIVFKIDQPSCGTTSSSPIIDAYIDGVNVATVYNQITPGNQASRTVSVGVHAVQVLGSRGANYSLTNLNIGAGVTVTLTLVCTS